MWRKCASSGTGKTSEPPTGNDVHNQRPRSQTQSLKPWHRKVITTQKPKFDFLIVGAGFSGLVIAERLCTQLGKSCLVVDKRSHIGGNCHDELNSHGVLVHKYGPHYFRTDLEHVREYLSQFTEWIPAEYIIKSFADHKYWSFPINLNTFEELIGRKASSGEFQAWLARQRVDIPEPRNSEEVVVSQVGIELYEKFFRGYTLKQWKKDPRELDPSVCGRIPIRTNRDDRYLREKFQAMPKFGYARLFQNMIAACGDKLRLELGTDFSKARDTANFDFVVYTGPIDAFFDYCFGPLPYRSLRFEPESFTPERLRGETRPLADAGFWQPFVQVNYPNHGDFTRVVEIKHVTKQAISNTTIVREYPADYEGGADPYYPIPNEANRELYTKYKKLAAREKSAFFLGRLAQYRYLNMDQVVAAALTMFDQSIASLYEVLQSH